jgi:hypothetical protein
MLRMSMIFVFLLSGLILNLSGQQAQQPETNVLLSKVRIVEQKYCRGDADAFTVSLGLDIEIENPSETPVHLLWPLVPWVGKVASSVGDAQAGRFLFEQTASHYPQTQTHFELLELKPGKTVTKRSGYYLIARRDAAVSLPGSVSPGRYAVVLVLSPEEVPPAQMHGSGILESMTTKPFVVEIPAHRKLVSCEAGAKAQ